jgi:hypothetical protein
MSRYLPFREFQRLYPLGKKLTQHTSIGHPMYESTNKSEDEGYTISFLSFPFAWYYLTKVIRNINYHSHCQHPCILPLIAWSYRVNCDTKLIETYMAFPRIMHIRDALRGYLLTPLKMVEDILSAMQFLTEHKIVHNLRQTESIVYYNGHVCLYNFGDTEIAIPYLNGDFFYNTHHYESETYTLDRSDECFDMVSVWNNIGTALDELHVFPETTYATNLIKTIDDKMRQGKTAQEILTEIDLCLIEGTYYETPSLTINDHCESDLIADCIGWLIQTHQLHKTSSRALFWAIHLFHRTWAPLRRDLILLHETQLYLQCLLSLATMMDTPSGWMHLQDSVESTVDMLLRIVIHLDGVITTPTYWDLARNQNDLIQYLYLASGCNYNYPSIPEHARAGRHGIRRKDLPLQLPNGMNAENLQKIADQLDPEYEGQMHPVDHVLTDEERLCDIVE